MAELLEQNNTVYQDKIVDFLVEEYSITVSQSTVSRLLKQLQITHKKVERAHEERDNLLRAHWVARFSEYRANQLVFMDESAANERTKDRKWG